MNNRHARLTIQGLVQGVSFRASAREVALRLELRGHVRNLPDGSVEAIVEGAEEAVEAFIAWARQGPEEAMVASVTISPGTPTGQFSSFQVVR
jgi:acylphosphatase